MPTIQSDVAVPQAPKVKGALTCDLNIEWLVSIEQDFLKD